MVDVKKAWEEKITQALVDAGLSDEKAREIVNSVVYDAIEDEKWDAKEAGRDAGFSTGWDSALASYMD